MTLPFKKIQFNITTILNQLANLWMAINAFFITWILNPQYTVSGYNELKTNDWSLIISNHQSWADILIIQYLLHKKLAPMKFFLKQQLLYVPVLGLCWWALDYPFMKRYSKKYLAKHPEMAGKDLQATREACNKFKKSPVTIINFLEGTRFTTTKHLAQQSPYQYLLKPKAGGLSFVLTSMGEQINQIIDLTIFYPLPYRNFWDFLCGRMKKAEIIIKVHTVNDIIPCYNNSDTNTYSHVKHVRRWVNHQWKQKDDTLIELYQTYKG